MILFGVQRGPWRVTSALLCLLLSGMSHAAEPIAPLSNQHEAPSRFPASYLKDGLVWLRDLTITSLTPKSGSVRAGATNWDDETNSQFGADHPLFKPCGAEANRIMVKRLLEQQSGVQVRDNLRFQYDLNRFRTVDDQQEIGVKLGIRFEFR